MIHSAQFYRFIASFLLPLSLFLASCSGTQNIPGPKPPPDIPPQVRAQADSLSKTFLITDGHIDIPYRLNNKWEDISVETAGGDFDYPRAKRGGLDAPFMSIYVPWTYQESGKAKVFADSLIDMVYGLMESHPDKFGPAMTVQEMEDNFRGGLMSLPMGMENGAPIEEDISNVEYFHKRGIRYVTLTHSRDNKIGDSSYDTTGTHGGLSTFGEQVVKEMNRVGIMIDISHISDRTFNDVMKLTKAPVIASHSSARHYLPGFERNMSDDMIRKLAENDGVIMINFGSTFMRADSRARRTLSRSLFNAFIGARQLDSEHPDALAYQAELDRKYPMIFASIVDVVEHIDHVVKLVGVEHVGFGSDFDGVGDTLPVGIKDVSFYPDLIAQLLLRGYSESDIEKICSGNLIRVWKQVEKVAEMSN